MHRTLSLLSIFGVALGTLPRDARGQAFDCVHLNDDNTNIFTVPDECLTLPENAIWCNCVRSIFTNPVKGEKSGFNQAVQWITDQPGIGNHRVEVGAGTLDVTAAHVGDVIGSTLLNELIPQSVGVPPGTFFVVKSKVQVTAVNADSIDFDIIVTERSLAAKLILKYDSIDACHYNGLLYSGRLTSLGSGHGFVLEIRYPKERIQPADATCDKGYHPAVEEDDAGGPGFTVRFLFMFFTTESGLYTLPSTNTIGVDTTLRRFTDATLDEILDLGAEDLCVVRDVGPVDPPADPDPCKIIDEVLQVKTTAGENSPPTAAITMLDPDNASLITDPALRQKACGNARIIFRGGNSDDGDGGLQTLSYEWFIGSGPAGGATIPEDTRLFKDTEITFADVGTYEVGLRVNDGGAANNTSEVTVSVTVEEDPIGNLPPTADLKTQPNPPAVELVAGHGSITLDGSASSNGAPGVDDCMQALAFQWTQLDGPPGKTAAIAAPTEAMTEVAFDFPGDYTFGLEVNDGQPLDNTARAEVTVTVTGDPASPSFRRGDSDGNGKLELTDAVRTLGWLFLGTKQPACLDAADSDDNGKVELTDAIRGLNYLFIGGQPPAPPGPAECGQDPTEDAFAACVYERC
jgi:hypothetical protein